MTFAMLVSLFLVVCFSVTYGNHFLSSQNVSWEEARTLCDMVVPPVNNNGSLVSDVPIDTETVTTTLAWVGRYISTSGWIQFEGCFNTAEAFINMTFDLTPSDANRVWTCHNLCPGNHFGITMTTCYCYTSSSRYTDIARVCGDNYRNESTGGFHGVDGCVCKYTKSLVSFSPLDVGNCLNILYFETNRLITKARCNSSRYLLGISGSGNGSFRMLSSPNRQGSWFDNIKQCQSLRCILPKRLDFENNRPIRNQSYWLNTFRVQLYSDQSQLHVSSSRPEQCLALRITGKRGAEIEIRNCSDKLPVVCGTRPEVREGLTTHIIIIIIVCVLVCIAVLVVSVTCTLKHTHPKRIPDQSHSHGADDGHEYHEIDVSTTGRMHAETLGIYNMLHEPAPLDSHSTHSVYDHVQNPDYDEVSRMCKFSINPDPGDYDRVEDIRK